ncbi:MAG: outer membrane beta-barrel protein [Alphaproteobacteria bacterium]|nr:outer membrane beta-barrel protein [Alphaproteobacteria bacterium]
MRCTTTLLASACALALVGSAKAEPVRWYAGVEGGWNNVIDDDVRFVGTVSTPTTHLVATKAEAQFDSGWALIATLGMEIGGGWRMEGEAGYRSNDLKLAVPTTLQTITKGGSLDELSLMGNWLLDLPLNKSGDLKLSLGFGVGLDHASLKTDSGFDASEWSIAYQGIVGVALAIDDETDLTLNYRHFRVYQPKFEDHLLANSTVRFDEIGENTLTIGLRRAF